MKMKLIGIFCGFLVGEYLLYFEIVCLVGCMLVQQGLVFVYGGGKVGLMGVVVDLVLEVGGVVIGVMLCGLVEWEIVYCGLMELYVVEDMYEWKIKMVVLVDGFIVLLGGVGMFEEIFE